MKRLGLLLVAYLMLSGLCFGDQETFELRERIYAAESPRMLKDLWVAAMMDSSEGTDTFRSLLSRLLLKGRVVEVPPYTKMRLTGRNTGMAAEVTIEDIDGIWSVPAKPIRDLGIKLPPNNYDYIMTE